MAGKWRGNWSGAIAKLLVLAVLASSCTLYHSKIPVAGTGDSEISPDAVFVTEDDSGLALLGIFVVAEPDHYTILVERARRRYKCERLHHVQLDFYTDYWLFVGFPIARITAICEKQEDDAESTPVAPKPVTPTPVEKVAPPVPPTPPVTPPVTPEPATPPDAIVPG